MKKKREIERTLYYLLIWLDTYKHGHNSILTYGCEDEYIYIVVFSHLVIIP